jgi:hypothetical protein
MRFLVVVVVVVVFVVTSSSSFGRKFKANVFKIFIAIKFAAGNIIIINNVWSRSF